MHTFVAFDRITVDPDICFGKPCIADIRISVASVLAHLSGGMTVDEYLKDFYWITKDDVLQAMAFASNTVEFRIVPFKKAS